MNNKQQNIINIFDKKVTLKRTANIEKQAKIKKIILNNIKIEGLKNETNNHN